MRKKLFFTSILTSFFIFNSCQENYAIKPNIVWLVIEDQSQYFFPFYGDNTIELQNINQLLDNGIVYEGMNSPYPGMRAIKKCNYYRYVPKFNWNWKSKSL